MTTSRLALLPVLVVLATAPILVAGMNPTLSFAALFSLIVLSLLLHKLQQINERELRMRWGVLETLTLLFLFLAAVSAIFSIDYHASVSELLRYAAYVMLAWVIRKCVVDRLSLRAAIAALILGGGAAAWWGLKQYVGQLWAGGDVNWRIFSTFYNPNLLAGYLELTFFLACVSFGIARERVWKMLAGFALLLIAAALPLTGSKGGALAVVLGSLVAVLSWKFASAHASPWNWKRILPFVLIACLAGSFVARPLVVRLRAAASEQANSAYFRWLLWKSTMRIVREHPLLGTGPGTFEFAYPRVAIAGFTRMAHQNYLQLAAEGGVGLAAVFILLLFAAGAAAFCGIRSGDREISLWGCGVLGSLAASAIHGLVDYTWYVPAIAIGWMAVTSLAFCLGDMCAQPTPRKPNLSVALAHRWSCVTVLLLVLCVLIIPSLAQWRLSLAAHLCDSHQRTHRESRLPVELIATARRCTALAPRSGACHSQLGNLCFANYMATRDRAAQQEAEREFYLAISCQPTVASHYLRLGRLRAADQQWPQAEACLRVALTWNPNYTSALLLLGQVAERQQRPAAARDYYGRIVAISMSPVEQYKAVPDLYDENYIQAHFSLGRLNLASQHIPAALAEFDKAIKWADTYLQSGNPLLNAPVDPNIPTPGPVKGEVKKIKAQVLVWKAKGLIEARYPDKANSLVNEALELDPGVIGLVNEIIKR